jgi:hypothetical protein
VSPARPDSVYSRRGMSDRPKSIRKTDQRWFRRTFLPRAVVWLKDILPATFANTRPASLESTEMLTNPVQVLDLSITLPMCVVAGVWLWRRHPWGYLLAGVLLTMLVIESASIATDQVLDHLHEPSASLGAVPLFVVLGLVGLLSTVALLRNVWPGQNARVR